jgi:YHS domain-containing protein
MAKDYVCGMKVDEKKTAATSTHAGTVYYFCSKNCKTEFDKNPTRYVKYTQTVSKHKVSAERVAF